MSVQEEVSGNATPAATGAALVTITQVDGPTLFIRSVTIKGTAEQVRAARRVLETPAEPRVQRSCTAALL